MTEFHWGVCWGVGFVLALQAVVLMVLVAKFG